MPEGSAAPPAPRPGHAEVVRIRSLALGGEAVARLASGRVVFVSGALPGELARIRLTRIRKSHAEAEALEVLEASPERRSPRCQHFGVCGGCRHQDLSYASQLVWKTQQVRETLERLGGLGALPVEPALGMEDPWFYRNKMEFAIAAMDGEPIIGLRERGRFDRVFDLFECPIFSPRAGELVAAVEEHCRRQGYGVYDPHRQAGFLRHLLVRESKQTTDLLVALVTGPGELAAESFVGCVLSAVPATSIWHIVSSSRANVIDYQDLRLLHGTVRISEVIPPLTFEFTPSAFFQTNTRMAEVLYRKVRDLAQLSGTETLVDLYCGIGTFALFLADQAARVIGMEAGLAAVEDARRNAELNAVSNAEFHVGDDRRGFPQLLGTFHPGEVQTVLLDPPRGGVHARCLGSIKSLAPPRVIYVSCNPATLARDLAIMTAEPMPYAVELVQPLDLFPHTPHIETIVRLALR
jgi:23S rRNA (uracil1939-C5)-methyltransferase